MNNRTLQILAIITMAVACSVIASVLTVYAFGDRPKVSVPHTFSPGTTIESTKVNQNFTVLANAINDNADRLNGISIATYSTGSTYISISSGNAAQANSPSCGGDILIACNCIAGGGGDMLLTKVWLDESTNSCECAAQNNGSSSEDLEARATCMQVVIP